MRARALLAALLLIGTARPAAADASLPSPKQEGADWIRACASRFARARGEMAREFPWFAAAAIEPSRSKLFGVGLVLKGPGKRWFDANLFTPWDDPRPDQGWVPGIDDRSRFFRARFYRNAHGWVTVRLPVEESTRQRFVEIFERAIDDCAQLVPSE